MDRYEVGGRCLPRPGVSIAIGYFASWLDECLLTPFQAVPPVATPARASAPSVPPPKAPGPDASEAVQAAVAVTQSLATLPQSVQGSESDGGYADTLQVEANVGASLTVAHPSELNLLPPKMEVPKEPIGCAVLSRTCWFFLPLFQVSLLNCSLLQFFSL